MSFLQKNEKKMWRQEGMANRIAEHPILGVQEKGKLITFYFDGKEVEGYEGEPIAAALKAAGLMVHRYTKKEHKPRGIFCAIGRCTDCVMVVDGVPNVRTCITPLKAGMDVKTQYGVSEKPFEEQ
jgi:predicted molibdopterin-dependent oxidoreductase YjgC